MVMVYRFKKDRIHFSDQVESDLWATEAYIQKNGHLIEGSGVEIDERYLVPGEQYTEPGFDPRNPKLPSH